jgi:catechol 2,3-dioxygenase-like lactoylglutathione lyase family enzyme
MAIHLDHLILAVNDRQRSIDFYTRIFGFAYEGERAPFSLVRVTADLVLQLAPFGTRGGEHLAFAMTRTEFDTVFQSLRDGGIDYGDSFDAVGNGRGPGEADGAHGSGAAIYCFDPNRHLIEIRHYGA